MNDKATWIQRIIHRVQSYTFWLMPGVGVKRWFFMILFGTALIGIGIAVLVLEVYRTSPDTWWLPLFSAASLRFFSRPLRAVIYGGIGIGLILLGIRELNRALLRPFMRPGRKMVDTYKSHRQREKGPRIVAIGGGHGLATLLRGMKAYTNNITAVVTVADDGGSSGRLRQEMGILPPGDLRNCLAALSNDEAMMGQIFQYRFPDGKSGLNGHSLGNLFITALTEITGSFEEAIAESSRVLAVQGQVLPATLHNVTLLADKNLPHLISAYRVEGESKIPEGSGNIQRVWLEPNNPPAFPKSIQSILTAEVIVIGPGSLYTSILPNLLVPDLAEAIRASKALKLFVCNVATQIGETDGFNCRDHITALEEHDAIGLFDVVIANNRYEGNLPSNIDWVYDGTELDKKYAIYYADLVDRVYPWRHDPKKLSQVIIELFQERTGPLVE